MDGRLSGCFRRSAACDAPERGGAWGDYDNDGDLDVLLAGNNLGASTVALYDNSGGPNPTFSETVTDLDGVYYGAAAFGDIDNDHDLDIDLAGTGPWYWSVPANDHTYEGSFFALEQAIVQSGVGEGAAPVANALWSGGPHDSILTRPRPSAGLGAGRLSLRARRGPDRQRRF